MKNAWQYLGTDVSEATTALKALQLGGLAGWKLRKEALTTESGIEIYGKYALSRTDTRGVLGLVGTRHKVIQNEDLAPLLDSLEDHLDYDAAGQIGSVVYITLSALNGDQVAVINGHDSKTSLSIMMSPMAGETLLNVGESSLKIDLTLRGFESALRFMDAYSQWFGKVRRVLQDKPLSMYLFDQIIYREFGAPDDAGASAVTRTRNKMDIMSKLFHGTGMDTYNGLVAMCTWYDHYSPVRGDDSVRARKAILEPGFKNVALNLMLDF